MNKYEKLLSYIYYFTTAGEEAGTWMNTPPDFPYVKYSKEISSFIHEIYETDLMDTEYLSHLKEHLPTAANLADYIETADFRLLRAILSYYVRQERFQEGLWGIAVEKHIFLNLLNRLRDISNPD